MTDLSKKLLQAYHIRIKAQLSDILQGNMEDLCDRLEQFLSEHWQVIKGSPLSYTALPEDEVTLILVEVAKYVSQHKYNNKIPAIKLLMPSVYLYSIDTDYKNLDTQDLNWVLKNYIIGRDGLYLIPVRQLSFLMTMPPQKWFNVYYDVMEQEESRHTEQMVCLSQEDVTRLAQHSVCSENLYTTYNYYQNSISASGSLLMHLKQLASALEINSTDRTEINECNAGVGAYNAVILFNEYYQSLAEEIKLQIPKGVKKELEFLLEISRDLEANNKANQNLANCIASRKRNLLDEINQAEASLALIGVDDEAQKALIKNLGLQYDNYKEEFLTISQAHGSYKGCDKLPITTVILQKLGLNYLIECKEDMDSFMKLTFVEIKNLIQDEKISNQVVNYLKDLETFMIFTGQNPTDKFVLVLKYLGKSIGMNIIKSSGNLLSLLRTVNLERSRILCEAFKECLPRVFTNYIEFTSVLQYLSTEQCSLLCATLKGYLPTIIKDQEMKSIKKHLSAEKTSIICNALKNGQESHEVGFFTSSKHTVNEYKASTNNHFK